MTAKEKLELKKIPKNEEIPVPLPTAKKANKRFTIEQILNDCITEKTPILPEIHISKINGANFMTDGELSTISGLPKVGKSTVVSFVIATALMKDIPDDLDTLKIRTDYTTKNIVYIDTEQSVSGTASTLKRVLNLAKMEKCPPNLKYCNVRQLTIEDRIEHFKTICDNLPNIAFIVVDGITDFVTGVNDEISSNEVIEMLMYYSSTLNIPILLIIHETYGGKIRGQLGSQLERKVGGAISIKKHKEHKCFSIEPKFIRYGADFDDVYYQYNPMTAVIESMDKEEVDAIKKQEDSKAAKIKELTAILEKVFNGSAEGMTAKNLKTGIGMHQVNKEGATRDAKNGLTKRHFENIVKYELVEFKDEHYFFHSENPDLFSKPIETTEPNF